MKQIIIQVTINAPDDYIIEEPLWILENTINCNNNLQLENVTYINTIDKNKYKVVFNKKSIVYSGSYEQCQTYINNYVKDTTLYDILPNDFYYKK